MLLACVWSHAHVTQTCTFVKYITWIVYIFILLLPRWHFLITIKFNFLCSFMFLFSFQSVCSSLFCHVKIKIQSTYIFQVPQLIILVVLFVFIVFGNICVLVAIGLSHTGRKTRMNFFIVNLAVSGKLNVDRKSTRLNSSHD